MANPVRIVTEGARVARRLVGGSKTASRLQKASGNPVHASKMKTKQEVAQLAKNTKAMQDRATAALESGKYKKVGAAKPSRKTVETPKPAKKSTTAVVGANIRKAKAGVVKPTRVSSAQAAKAARDVGKAPVPRNRPALKAGADRKTGLSPSEFKQKSKVDTITRPKPRQPRSETQIKKDNQDKRNAVLRKSLTPRKPIGTTKNTQPRVQLPKHKVDVELGKTRSTKTVVISRRKIEKLPRSFGTGEKGASVIQPVKSKSELKEMTKAASEQQANSLVRLKKPSISEGRGNTQQPPSITTQKPKRTREQRIEARKAKRANVLDERAAKALPNRYSGASKELGNRIATERNVAIGEAFAQKEIARKAIERAKIAATPREIKKVDKTLEAAKIFRANKAGARIRRNKTDRGK